MSLRVGHVVDQLRALVAEGERAQCIVTSPPYWGLRDYGTPPEIWGGAPMCDHSFSTSTKVRRGGPQGASGQLADRRSVNSQAAVATYEGGATCVTCDAWRGHLGLESLHDCLAWARGEDPCSSCYVCHMRVVFALAREVLADDGLCWLNLGDRYASAARGRDENSTLEGTRRNQAQTRRAAVNRRHVVGGLKPKDLAGVPWRVALALQADGWFLRQDVIWSKRNPMPESVTDRCTKSHEYVFMLSKSERYKFNSEAIAEPANFPDGNRNAPGNKYAKASATDERHRTKTGIHKIGPRATRNKRSVWDITTKPFTGPHYATFPQELPRTCILASTSPGDTVLDPFMGSGTVGRVALQLGRRWLGIDLDPRNAAITKRRTTTTQGLALA